MHCTCTNGTASLHKLVSLITGEAKLLVATSRSLPVKSRKNAFADITDLTEKHLSENLAI